MVYGKMSHYRISGKLYTIQGRTQAPAIVGEFRLALYNYFKYYK